MEKQPLRRANVWKSLVVVFTAILIAGVGAVYTPDYHDGYLHLKRTDFLAGFLSGQDSLMKVKAQKAELTAVANAEDSIATFVENNLGTSADSNRQRPGNDSNSIFKVQKAFPLLPLDTALEDTSIAPIIDYGADSAGFAVFYEKLVHSKSTKGKVRIAYFGDLHEYREHWRLY